MQQEGNLEQRAWSSTHLRFTGSRTNTGDVRADEQLTRSQNPELLQVVLHTRPWQRKVCPSPLDLNRKWREARSEKSFQT